MADACHACEMADACTEQACQEGKRSARDLSMQHASNQEVTFEMGRLNLLTRMHRIGRRPCYSQIRLVTNH